MTFDQQSRAYDYSYDDDTEVVDVEEPPFLVVALPRVPTEDLAVHVLVEGYYHRRHPRLAKTSCGKPIQTQFAPIRREELRHPLSTQCRCFTDEEIAEADELHQQENEGTR